MKASIAPDSSATTKLTRSLSQDPVVVTRIVRSTSSHHSRAVMPRQLLLCSSRSICFTPLEVPLDPAQHAFGLVGGDGAATGATSDHPPADLDVGHVDRPVPRSYGF